MDSPTPWRLINRRSNRLDEDHGRLADLCQRPLSDPGAAMCDPHQSRDRQLRIGRKRGGGASNGLDAPPRPSRTRCARKTKLKGAVKRRLNQTCRSRMPPRICGPESKRDSCCVKVVRLRGKYVRSPAGRPPSRCGPSSDKHPNIRTSEHPNITSSRARA
jgi:hypothetical protein